MFGYESYDDVELIILLRKGDLNAFTTIHKRYYGVLYSHAYKRLPDREEVKDILQELFTYIWNNKETIKFNINLQAYLYTAVRNKILNVFKHQKVKSDYITSFEAFLVNDQPTPDETLRIKELISIINAEVRALPPQMRLIFEMSRNANLSHLEIAEKLQISPLTVKKQVNNSLRILRVKLGTHFFMMFFLIFFLFHLLPRQF
ncbi:RNA polymerase sigma-70 factor (ECF subfamily) [Mucilaginibacter frigoritolerans]|uniref:RNA polymerase sigma-70 factor (ECF subfamily) n=1 Tax=Mucilaginibacter frigoritolerans TaxID=652788 RepID=A0A562TV90_9SPHI|nr:RNA polymerase sigma-70 factor [Mucilaginibacter frigoritolerans]TWI97531.1 RNA polymerase sigma-70 factor (ECF subfamily) [Mucilaginibacter frigoritolerans]